MPELTALHFTDLHEDTERLEFVTKLAEAMKGQLDVVYFTGDFIGENKQAKKKVPNFKVVMDRVAQQHNEIVNAIKTIQNQYGINTEDDLSKLPEDIKKQFIQLNQILHQIPDTINNIGSEAYTRLRPGFEKLANLTTHKKVVGVLGNHDFKLAYDTLGDIIEFVETTDSIKVKGKTKDFVIQGDVNSCERPKYHHGLVQHVMQNQLINYDEGHSVDDVDPSQRSKLKKIVDAELARLKKANQADMFLLHKSPYFLPKESIDFSTGDVAKQYASRSYSMYSGHEHGASIERRDGKPVFNPGSRYVFIYSYGSGKTEIPAEFRNKVVASFSAKDLYGGESKVLWKAPDQ